MPDRFRRPRPDSLIALALAAGALALYAATLLPGVGSGDTAEFQRVLPTLGVAHPTGYPLYTMLGWLWSWLPLGTPAWRISMFSATAAALAVVAVYLIARSIGQSRMVATGAALALAASRTFWSQATIAEVYALAALIQALLVLALLRWRAGRWPLWVAGLLLGLGLAHHRTIVLMLPGAVLFVGRAARGRNSFLPPRHEGTKALRGEWKSEYRQDTSHYLGVLVSWWLLFKQSLRPVRSGEKPISSLASQAAFAVLAALAGGLLYLYLPLRAPPWLDSWQTFVRHISGSDALGVWLTVDAPARVALEHLRELWSRFVWPQFFPIGAVLALLGLARLWQRDRPLAALLTAGYLLVLLFCVLFFVQDVEVFMISAHLIAALLIGEGAMLIAAAFDRPPTTDHRPPTNDQRPPTTDHRPPTTDHRPPTTDHQQRPTSSSVHPSSFVLRPSSFILRSSSFAGLALLVLPALLLASNLPGIRAANTRLPELAARATLAQPLPRGALLLIDWEAVEPLRYLQQIEGLRPDLEVRPLNEDVARQDVDTALKAGRAAYLLHALPSLGLAQAPEGRLWRVASRPIELRAATPASQAWQDGIALRGFTLPRGPYRPGDIVPVTLDWRALSAPRGNYTLFVHVAGPDGAVWGQQDRPPAPAPTGIWQPGAEVMDLYGPALRLDTPPGRYKVVLGWYAYPSLERLALASGDADTYTLGEIEVVALK